MGIGEWTLTREVRELNGVVFIYHAILHFIRPVFKCRLVDYQTNYQIIWLTLPFYLNYYIF